MPGKTPAGETHIRADALALTAAQSFVNRFDGIPY
jgi:hypothetical protein